LTGALYLDQPDEIAEFEDVWSEIVDGCLSLRETEYLLTKKLEGLS
jgi:hypothetical protein